jgi:hypothetical protein
MRLSLTPGIGLLVASPGSPATVHTPARLDSPDGEDVTDGLCVKNAERSRPEPVPVSPSSGPIPPTPR